MRTGSWLSVVCAGAVGMFAAAGPAHATEQLPVPTVDYVADGSFIGGRMQVRHRDGMMRIEMDMTGSPFPVVGYFDRGTGKAVMVVETPAGRMGMEVAAADQPGYGVTAGRGVREGRDSVAGEACDVWKVETGSGPVFACVTVDGIALRTETIQAGKRETVFQIAKLTREAQDPALFRVPANLKLMSVPGGRAPGPAR